MSNIAQKQLIDLFKSYSWNILFEKIKDTQYDKTKPIQSQQTLAMKAMLLVAWWGDSGASKALLKHFPPLLKDPLVHFCVTYGYICLADMKKIKHYLSKIPKSTPKWMRAYLDIELYGRSLKFDKQISLVKQLTPKNQYPQEYIVIALLQSLEHQKADIKYLKEYTENIKLKNSNEPLNIALCIRAREIDIKDMDISKHPLILSKYANYLYAKYELVDALKHYDQLAQTKFLDIDSINKWLNTSVSIPQGKDSMLQRVEFGLKTVPNSLFIQGTIVSYALIDSYIKGNYSLAYNLVQKFIDFLKLIQSDSIKNAQIFFKYILNLCIYWQHNKEIYNTQKEFIPLYVYGESHSLSLSNIKITHDNKELVGKTNFIMGIKMHHLKPNKDTFHSKALQLYFEQTKTNSNLLFTIGEIDTRPAEGIWKVHREKDKPVNELVEDTVSNYIEFLDINLKPLKPNSVTIQGVPAPGYEFKDDFDPIDHDGFLDMIKQVNTALQQHTLDKGWYFLDVYSATVGEDKKSNKKHHIDGIHLKPSIYKEVDKWLIKPKQKEQPKAIDYSKYTTISLSKPS